MTFRDRETIWIFVSGAAIAIILMSGTVLALDGILGPPYHVWSF